MMDTSTCDERRRLDEICSLESIFNTDEIKRSDEHGPSAGQFFAHVEIPKDFKVIYERGSSKEEFITVAFLPPIVLHYSLPEEYPSNPKTPPSFTLTCHWLSRFQLSQLCTKLDALWEENQIAGQGSEILYTWAQFLKSESLEYLKVVNSLDITPIQNAFLSRYVLNSLIPGSSKGAVADKITESLPDTPAKDSEIKPSSKIQISSPSQKKMLVKEPTGEKSSWTCVLEDNVNNCQSNSVEKCERSGVTRKKKPVASRILDCRAVNDAFTGDISLFEFLDSYSETQINQDFCRQVHLCNICFETKLGSHFTKFLPCKHIFCKECIGTYFFTCINDGKIQHISCPDGKCSSEAQFNQIKENVTSELFIKFDKLLLDATLDALGDVRCPRPNCRYSVSRDEADGKLATCFYCRYAFCVECKMGYHGVEPCRFKCEEEFKLAKEYQEANEQRRSELERRYSKGRLEMLVQNTKTKQWIEDNSKSCPHCKACIQKSFGCNKMVCGKCSTHFCWLCSAKLDPRFPYLHFNKTGSKCFNLLFQGIEVENEEFLDDIEEEWFDFDE